MTRAGLWVNASIAGVATVVCTPLAVVFGYKWLALDEANRVHSCGSGSRGAGTCFSGEWSNMVLTLVFAGIAALGIVLCVWMLREWRAERST